MSRFFENIGLYFNVAVSVCNWFHGEHHRAFLNVPSSHPFQLLTKNASTFCPNGHLSQEAPLPIGNASIWRSVWGVLCHTPSFNETSILNELLRAVKGAVSIHWISPAAPTGLRVKCESPSMLMLYLEFGPCKCCHRWKDAAAWMVAAPQFSPAWLLVCGGTYCHNLPGNLWEYCKLPKTHICLSGFLVSPPLCLS